MLLLGLCRVAVGTRVENLNTILAGCTWALVYITRSTLIINAVNIKRLFAVLRVQRFFFFFLNKFHSHTAANYIAERNFCFSS